MMLFASVAIALIPSKLAIGRMSSSLPRVMIPPNWFGQKAFQVLKLLAAIGCETAMARGLMDC
ncbi:MAG: hypothetical protein J0H25_17615 [Rhizobiales bacterium]|nr:hypothetical protein [Hyphomicrobiales bacterium]